MTSKPEEQLIVSPREGESAKIIFSGILLIVLAALACWLIGEGVLAIARLF